ncbi:hypothetical protein F3Y22_tig00113721pilonHSYRG00168 [Hibiscus syriacus]|uniref:Uncharacterized protein n=1 Tax=Hibiscus syriacus TaxID=106335 RepID=A0A6A2XZ50_HIBSY|nr:hypothetical protein F3Y22_tig00113721pilonHSYRG00168 [Hibiscus syriacus]
MSAAFSFLLTPSPFWLLDRRITKHIAMIFEMPEPHGGHDKAVSYVKFLDSGTVVTASTDNTLKLWDLNKTSSGGLSSNACSLTFRGHTNEKNFVGLSVADGYIACGSETNEVYAYHRSMPMPITSHKFGSLDPISGKETDDNNGLFVSSVCWRGKSDMAVAASSSGCIKVLQMV